VDQGDPAADRRFRGNVTDHQAARRAGETTIRDQHHVETLPDNRCRDLKHLAHSGAANWPFVADDQHVAVVDLVVLDGMIGFLFAVKDARRATKLLRLDALELDDRAVGADVALEDVQAAVRVDRVAQRADYLLTGRLFGSRGFFAERFAG